MAVPVAAEPYRLVDEFWKFTYEAPGLRKLLTPGQTEMLFKGRCLGDVFVDISVLENVKPRTANEWRDSRKGEGSKLEDARIFFSRKKHGVFNEKHGYAFYARGHQCFVVHAWVPDSTSDKDIRVALKGLKLGEDKGCGLRVRKVALLTGKNPLDPKVMLEAGKEYLQKEPVLAVPVFVRARRILKPKQLKPEEEAQLFYYGGMALIETKDYVKASGWLREAEKKATGDDKYIAGYHLARAAAAANLLDDAFAALRRAFSDGLVVGKAQLSKERELENARKDPRWEPFWMKHVEGK